MGNPSCSSLQKQNIIQQRNKYNLIRTIHDTYRSCLDPTPLGRSRLRGGGAGLRGGLDGFSIEVVGVGVRGVGGFDVSGDDAAIDGEDDRELASDRFMLGGGAMRSCSTNVKSRPLSRRSWWG
jgi:hypothetical protein